MTLSLLFIYVVLIKYIFSPGEGILEERTEDRGVHNLARPNNLSQPKAY